LYKLPVDVSAVAGAGKKKGDDVAMLLSTEDVDKWLEGLGASIHKYPTQYGTLWCLVQDLWIVASLRVGLVWEQHYFESFLVNHIIDSKVALDVGAHIGGHTLMWCHMNPELEVLAFEPQKVIYALLAKNVSDNKLDGRVKCYNNAVGHTQSSVKMHHSVEGREVQYGTEQAVNYGGIGLGERGEDAIMVSLDALDLPRVDFIKIDVEGAEGMVLLGAQETIAKFRPVIFIEHTQKRVNLSEDKRANKPLALLDVWDYDVKYVGDGNWICLPYLQ